MRNYFSSFSSTTRSRIESGHSEREFYGFFVLSGGNIVQKKMIWKEGFTKTERKESKTGEKNNLDSNFASKIG